MDDRHDFSNVGEQVRDAVQEAIESGDFKQLNNVVSSTVSNALGEAKKQMKKTADEVNEQSKNWSGNFRNPVFKDTFHYKSNATSGQNATWSHPQYNKPINKKNKYQQEKYQKAYSSKHNNTFLPSVKTNRVGSVSGTLSIVFGSIGTGIMSLGLIAEVITLFAGFPLAGALWQAIGWTAGLLAVSVYGIQRGVFKKDRLRRADRYIQLAGGKFYINIEDLAMHMRKSKRYILKDIKKMLRLGIFPEGHLDEEETCLMLSDATYREYLDVQRKRRIQQEEEKESLYAAKVTPIEDEPEVTSANPELDEMIAEGHECIRMLQEMNDDIEGEVISAKLYQLENLLKQIFDRIKAHPEQMPQMQKFMDYYLPTTLKLVKAYRDFDEVLSPGEDIRTAKIEIEKTLDTINMAFAELQNNLLRDTAFDVTTDAQVLKTMLAREGLTKEMGSDFVE
ncbi:5-bromo-4-chloroindolyl phosphate hydrolysis family protein [Lachnospiraceae bacterium OttesenSCG-928-D06]|nr:5-bromo-4-chloroindolyl phosphate hydrolysis family protein [Lachnospiraceae bacterium OttesenSCG-928-D06]